MRKNTLTRSMESGHHECLDLDVKLFLNIVI